MTSLTAAGLLNGFVLNISSFFARDAKRAITARAMCYRPSVRQSICHTGGSVKKLLKLGSFNFHPVPLVCER